MKMCKCTTTALEREKGNNPTSLVQRTGPIVAATSLWPDQTCQGEGICWSSGPLHFPWECFLWRVIYSSPARWALKVPRPRNQTAGLLLPFCTWRVVLCTPPCCRHLNKLYNLFDQAGNWLSNYYKDPAAIRKTKDCAYISSCYSFFRQTCMQRCKIWMSRSQLAQLRCSPLWPWQPRHLPPSSAGEGSAGGGWCWSATSASQGGPLRRNNSKTKS